MIILRLAGGLGNQIFQFGTALLLAKKNNIKKILIDDSALNKYEIKRENELDKIFNFSKLNIEIKFKRIWINKLRLPKLIPIKKLFYVSLISDKNFKTNINGKLVLMDGYFQWKLSQYDFNEIIDLLKNITYNNNLEQKNDCIIHIRGNDFIKLGWNNVASKEYYVNAINVIKEQFYQNKFYVVTDDKDYSRTILNRLNIDYEFIGENMYEDFYLIGSFKYRILSSSTFAFWASALGNNKNSIVIAPKYWIPNVERKVFLPNEIRI